MRLEEFTHTKDDGMIQHRFWPPNGEASEWIASFFAPDFAGYCIDVGASDGMSVNSTYLLEHARRWTVLSVEANPYFSKFLRRARAFVEMCGVAAEPKDSAEFHIHLDNLEAFSSLTPAPPTRFHDQVGEKWATTMIPVRTLEQLLETWAFPRLDALCIDTEGTEREVLKGIDLVKWSPRVILVENWEQGALDDVLLPLGYKRVLRSADNDGYVKS